MIHTQHAWFSVMPWAQVDRFDSTEPRPWTVLPFSGLQDTPTALTRTLWRQPYERQTIHPHPLAPATLIEPDLPEAIAILMERFPGSDVLESVEPGRFTVFTAVLHDLFLLGQHLTRDHAQPTERLALHVRTLADRQQYHAGLHQQVAMYPLPRSHWHR